MCLFTSRPVAHGPNMGHNSRLSMTSCVSTHKCCIKTAFYFIYLRNKENLHQKLFEKSLVKKKKEKNKAQLKALKEMENKAVDKNL